MITVEQELEKKLKHLRVRIDAPDGDTILLRNVPTGERFFNKPRTNLLIKRPREGMPYLICVDEDLDYIGADAGLAKAFVAGHRQQGWRVLSVGHKSGDDLQGVIEEALGLVGFEGHAPKLKPALPVVESTADGNLLARFAAELSIDVLNEPTIGREDRIEEALGGLLAWQPRLAVISGASGVGKTNLVHAIARRLKEVRPELKVLTVEMGALMAGTLFDSDRESLLMALLSEARESPNTIIVIEHLEAGLVGVPRGVLLLTDALDRGAKLIGTTLPAYVSRFQVEPLNRRLRIIELDEMSLSSTAEVLVNLRERIATHHCLTIPLTLLDSVVDIALGLPGSLPAKAITLLDNAASIAALSHEVELSTFDIHIAADKCTSVEA